MARAGYNVTFDPTFLAWLDRHLPIDGSSPEGFLDQEVTSRIVDGLPVGPGPVTVGLIDDRPGVVPAAASDR